MKQVKIRWKYKERDSETQSILWKNLKENKARMKVKTCDDRNGEFQQDLKTKILLYFNHSVACSKK